MTKSQRCVAIGLGDIAVVCRHSVKAFLVFMNMTKSQRCVAIGLGDIAVVRRHSVKAFLVFMVHGESKYLRRNYLNLLPLLGVDVTMGMEVCIHRNGPRSFEEMEDVIAKVLNLKPLKLSYLSSVEAMMLMKGENTDLTT
ncbi:hypothetical protein ZIOFF_016752 [Zingiber officinale]|uniref:Uncharacterized protein n=1 Tax=Zingiber officinale TaxID=94328 RepID=A0A8J5HKB8_ZINOF|nr:hypothetical protein ZIOFF_016752 [Zingiber officinale]